MRLNALCIAAVACVTVGGLLGCTGEGGDGPATQPGDTADAYKGPAFNAQLAVRESEPPQTIVNYEVTVPTGGWDLQRDRVEREDGVLKLYLTLTKPRPDEVVTQALETFRDLYDAGAEEVERAELRVKLLTRGESAGEAAYKLAAIAE